MPMRTPSTTTGWFGARLTALLQQQDASAASALYSGPWRRYFRRRPSSFSCHLPIPVLSCISCSLLSWTLDTYWEKYLRKISLLYSKTIQKSVAWSELFHWYSICLGWLLLPMNTPLSVWQAVLYRSSPFTWVILNDHARAGNQLHGEDRYRTFWDVQEDEYSLETHFKLCRPVGYRLQHPQNLVLTGVCFVSLVKKWR